MKDKLTDKFYERHAALAKNPDISARHIRKNQLEKFAQDFATVYNSAWAGHGGLKEMKKDMVLKMFKQMKPVMDEKIMWYVYEKDEPIALWVNLPDLNQWFKYLNGKFDLLGQTKISVDQKNEEMQEIYRAGVWHCSEMAGVRA